MRFCRDVLAKGKLKKHFLIDFLFDMTFGVGFIESIIIAWKVNFLSGYIMH